ncbi:unnamed protein product [Sphagnum balticum]
MEEKGFGLLEDKTELIHLIDRLLTELLRETRSLPKLKSSFDCREPPGISVLDYLKSKAIYMQEFASIRTVLDRYLWLL